MLDPEKLDEYMKNPENADKYIREIAKDFGCGKETVRVALKKLGYTRKKNRQNTESSAFSIISFAVFTKFKSNRKYRKNI